MLITTITSPVWNINYDTTEPELKDIFLSFGPARIKLMMDPNTNKNKGHAFVEYQEPAPATEAVKNLNGHFVSYLFINHFFFF